MKIGKHRQKKLLPRGIIQKSTAKKSRAVLNMLDDLQKRYQDVALKAQAMKVMEQFPRDYWRDTQIASKLSIALGKAHNLLRAMQTENKIIVYRGKIG